MIPLTHAHTFSHALHTLNDRNKRSDKRSDKHEWQTVKRSLGELSDGLFVWGLMKMFPSRQPFVKPDTSASAVRPACTLLPSHACIIINGDQSTMSMKVLVQGLYYLQWLKRLVQCGDPAEKHPENKPVCFRGTMNRHIAPPHPRAKLFKPTTHMYVQTE